VFDVRGARPGDFCALIRDNSGQLLSFEFQRGRADVYRIERNDVGNLVASRETAQLERRVLQLGGVVKRSLFDAMTDLGESPALVHAFTDIFAWDFDFSTQARPGDEFRLVFEKFYDKDGFVRYGRVQAAEYRAARRDFVAVWFEDESGTGGYYTPDGSAMRRSFLAAPLKYSRISSRYTMSRLHTILHSRRPHEGVDYAAPTGTPVGRRRRRSGVRGLERRLRPTVRVKHTNGYVSSYGTCRAPRGLRGPAGRAEAARRFSARPAHGTAPRLPALRNGRYASIPAYEDRLGEPVPPRFRLLHEGEGDAHGRAARGTAGPAADAAM
jgi:hypothetical protein